MLHKKQSFIVDVVSEESFYDNLTLGLPQILGKVRGIRNIQLEKRLPCDIKQISQWERKVRCILPTDMKLFYTSSDGFKLSWSFQMGDEVIPVGKLNINAISQLERVAGHEFTTEVQQPSLGDVELCNKTESTSFRPHFGKKCRAFELDLCEGGGKVCLVYMEKSRHRSERARQHPTIWLLDKGLDWHYLAASFTQYFRMLLMHHGLPEWHFKFTHLGISPWAEQWYLLVAPHLLKRSGKCQHRVTEKYVIPRIMLDATLFEEPKDDFSDESENANIQQ